MKRLLLISAMTMSFLAVKAQEPPRPDVDLQLFAEKIFPLQEEDLPYEELYENLLFFYTEPLDLNRASREALQSLYILSYVQVESLVSHIERNGPLLSLYELQAVPGFDLQTIELLLPFVNVRDGGLQADLRPLLSRIFTDGSRFALLRWELLPEQQAGFLAKSDSVPAAFLGSADKLYFRLRISKAQQFSFGLTAEKDAGERLQFRPGQKQWGADFYSFHAMLWNQGLLKRLAIGDFQLQWGQGLVLGAGFYLGKGAETISTVARPSLGIRPYTSVVESGFFRGIAATVGNKRAELSLFAARTPRDAQLRHLAGAGPDSLFLSDTDPYFSALQASGLHRTSSEIEGRNSLKEFNLGAAGRWKPFPGRFSIGFSSLYTRFSHLQQPLPRLYNHFAFRGQENWTGSIFAQGQWAQLTFFGEGALSRGGGSGVLFGLMAPLSHKLDVSLLYRYYTPDFYSFYGSGFAEGSRLQNEGGVYWGLKFQPSKPLLFTAYFDYFWFPWLRYRVSAPSNGYEYLLRTTWQPNKQLLIYGQYRHESKQLDLPAAGKVAAPGVVTRHNYLLNLDFKPDKHWQLRSRVQWSNNWQGLENSRGYVVAQDLSWGINNWRISARYALFQTDDWNSRQYMFERDVLWAFSVPAYYGRGTRYYAMLQWQAGERLNLWLRWARTIFKDREMIGSGYEQISGNTRSNLKLQVKFDF